MRTTLFLAIALTAAGCTPTIKTQNEITVKPMELTVNINLKVDQAITDALSSDAPASAGATDDLRARRRARRAKVKEWKSKGWVGENNKGLLELRVEPAQVTGDVTMTIATENEDRQSAFERVAKEQNSTALFVGQHWAARMADRAEPVTWLQDTNGNWAQKAAAETAK